MEIILPQARALVTGANSGIGRAIALHLASSGARVGINFVTDPDAAAAVAAEIRRAGSEALLLQADVADAAQVMRMFAQMDEAWGGVDLVVNNAGIDGGRVRGWEIEIEAWRQVLEVNLFGAFYCAREALRRMVPRRQGVIVNVTSVHEIIPWGGYSAYTTSKAALSMLTKTLAQEAAPFGVRVLAVAPGAIKTPINQAVWNQPRALADLLAKIPVRRMGDPDDVARVVVMMASDAAAYVTGTTVFVDGGMTLYPAFQHGG